MKRMRKNGFKILSISLLLSSLCLAGCSCSNEKPNVSEIKDGNILSGLTKDASDYSLLDIYNAVIASDAGNKAVANKLVDIVATTILKVDDGTTEGSKKGEYDALVDEKVKELKKDSKYFVNGKFSEELFLISLQAEGYEDEADYIDKVIRVEVLSKLLKERYIAEETLKNSKAVVTNKKIREVEYFSVSSSLESTYKDYTVVGEDDKEETVEVDIREFMRGVRDDIAIAAAGQNPTINFDTYVTNLKLELEKAVKAEADKITNAKDYSQELAAKYTNNYTQTVGEGLQQRLDAVQELTFTGSQTISSDSDASAIISSTITSKLLNLANPEEATKRAYKIGDWYYLVSANAGNTVDANDILLTETSDSSSYTYSIVRFKVINANNYDDNKDTVINLLASTSTLASGALSHYLEQHKNTITIHDDAVYEYLKKVYPNVFTD
jgi:hypothetical protein